MKEELKETINKLKKLCYDDYCLEFSVDCIDRKEEKILLDYITDLQEENKILKELNVCVGCNNNPNYKQRNEKAIYKLQDIIESNNGALSNPEYSIIGKHSLLKLENDNCYILLNILKGDKDE